MKMLIVGEPGEIAELFQNLATQELMVTDGAQVPGLSRFVPPANAPDEPLNDTNAHKDGRHPWTVPGQPGEAK